MISKNLRRIKLLIRELGLWTTVAYFVDRLLRHINRNSGLYYYHFVAQPLAEHPRLPLTRGRGFSFRLLLAHDPVLDALARPLEVLRQRFVQGAQCQVATRNDSLVGCIWFVRGVYAEDEVRVDYLLPQDGSCVWDFDVYVADSERLGFLFAKQWDVFDGQLKPQGVRYTLSRINAFNQRSLASHRSLGAQVCGSALFLRLGQFQFMLSNKRPFIAFGGRPKLRIAREKATKP